MAAQNLISNGMQLADAYMVGLLGEKSLAATTIAATPLYAFNLFSYGIQSGLAVLVAQYWGKADAESVNRALGVACYIAAGVSSLGALFICAFAESALRLMTSDASLPALGSAYLRIVAASQIFACLNLAYLAALRSMGNAKAGMYILSASSAVNVALNWALIFGKFGVPALGIRGAALATLAARIFESALAILHAKRNTAFKFLPRALLAPGRAMLASFLRYSLPVVANELAYGIGLMAMPVILGYMQAAQANLAAYNLSSGVERVCSIAMLSSCNATAIIVGREIGSGKPKGTVMATANSLAFVSLALGFACGLVLLWVRAWALPAFIYPHLALSDAARQACDWMLLIDAINLPIASYAFSMGIGAMRGGGDSKLAAAIDVGTLYVCNIAYSVLAAFVFRWGIRTVYLCFLFENVGKLILFALRFYRGKWIHDITRAA